MLKLRIFFSHFFHAWTLIDWYYKETLHVCIIFPFEAQIFMPKKWIGSPILAWESIGNKGEGVAVFEPAFVLHGRLARNPQSHLASWDCVPYF